VIQLISNLTNWIHRRGPEDPNLGSLAEMIAAVAGLAALGISVVALFIAWRSSKRSNFIRFQERLDEREVSEGRSIIYATKSVDEVAALFSARDTDSRWDRANRTVNLWNTLAQFTKLGIVDRKLSFDLWGDSVKEAWTNLEHFIRFRRGRADFEEMPGRKDKWSSLVWFASSAGVKVHPDLLPGAGENPLG
jgi:hypothetical protein